MKLNNTNEVGTELNFHVSLFPSFLCYLHILTVIDLVWTAEKESGLALLYMQRRVLLPFLNMQACYPGLTPMNTAVTKSATRNVTHPFPATIVFVTAPCLYVSLAGEWNKLTKFSLSNGPIHPQTCGNLPSLCWTHMFRHCLILGWLGLWPSRADAAVRRTVHSGRQTCSSM